ncbi:MAG: ABC transporter permease subunit, partial [Clostridiales bacterium]
MNKRLFSAGFWFSHLLLLCLLSLVFAPGQKEVAPAASFVVAIGLIEVFYCYQHGRDKFSAAPSGIVVLVWLLLILWELCTTFLNIAHPVLFPAPEDVFYVFTSQYPVLIRGVLASLSLLGVGFVFALTLGVGFGVLVGWSSLLRQIFYPIAYVLSPIPAVVFAPYLIAIMPTFRSASVAVIFLGIFWPTFLNMIIRVGTIDSRIIDSARVMGVSNGEMVVKILLPYMIPGVISGLKVSLAASV